MKHVIVLERLDEGGYRVKQDGRPIEGTNFGNLSDGFDILRRISVECAWDKRAYLDGVNQLISFSMRDTEKNVRSGLQ